VRSTSLPITDLAVLACTIPTDFPESDGTFEWTQTTIVIVEAEGGGHRGLGYTYAAAAAARLIDDMLGPVVRGMDCMDVPLIWSAMVKSVRNQGRPGIASCAISAVDAALWDLKARVLDLPLISLLGSAREAVPVYGSGGFTSYPVERLRGQFADWAAAGITRLKMKVGRDFEADRARVEAARNSIGNRPELFVDANGAYTRKQALAQAEAFAGADVTWFEEPVSSDDLEGLRLIRDRAPAGMDIAAGEYGYDLHYFRRMLDAGAVDILQADATRCAGITGFLPVGALCQAASVQLSAHTAPALHLHPCCALAPVVHIEWFHDHARIERMLFEGAIQPVRGVLSPDRSRPGMGLELRRSDAAEFLVYGRDAERAVR
jgi:L-alanine-DL-glutamate epimerase-like enolase superfamily enzyme